MVTYAPLSGTYTLANMIGFLISAFAVYPKWPSWGFAFMLVFLIMFLSSYVSMTKAEISQREELYLHEKHRLIEKQMLQARKALTRRHMR